MVEVRNPRSRCRTLVRAPELFPRKRLAEAEHVREDARLRREIPRLQKAQQSLDVQVELLFLQRRDQKFLTLRPGVRTGIYSTKSSVFRIVRQNLVHAQENLFDQMQKKTNCSTKFFVCANRKFVRTNQN